MKRILTAAVVTMLGLSSTILAANAQFAPYRGGSDGTRYQLQRRIDTGIRSGALTRGEARRLTDKLNRIGAMESNMQLTGGRLSRHERERINTDLARLSADIDRQLTDSETAWNSHHPAGNRYGYAQGRNWH